MAQPSTVEMVPLTGVIGAEVRGVDLRRSLAADDVAAIREALAHHLVVFFRDQPLSEDEQLAFARNFGKPWRHPLVRVHPETGVPALYLHRALSDHFPAHRTVRRVVVGESVPIPVGS